MLVLQQIWRWRGKQQLGLCMIHHSYLSTSSELSSQFISLIKAGVRVCCSFTLLTPRVLTTPECYTQKMRSTNVIHSITLRQRQLKRRQTKSECFFCSALSLLQSPRRWPPTKGAFQRGTLTVQAGVFIQRDL